ncbi:MAG: hypothetical protein WC809_19290 [Sinimarinibacterium sp.]|jgi:hypothetical protein
MNAMELAMHADDPITDLPDVDEEPMPEIEDADVHKCGDRLILLINGRPGALSYERAVTLINKLRAQLDARSH